MSRSKRQSNVEILRVTAMFMVTMLHALGHGGVLEMYEFGTFGYILFWTIEALCYVAVNVFVLITGYFMVTSGAKPSRFIKLYFQVEFYSMLCLLAAKFIFHQSIGLKNILNTLFPITSSSYWFVSAYAVLIVLVPLLNRFIKSMDQKQHFMTVALLTVLFCIIPTFMFWSRDILGNGYNFIWFIVLYITAAYIHLYSDDIPQKRGAIKYILAYLILGGDCPKTQNPNLKVEDKTNDMGLYESKVVSVSDYDGSLKQKVETVNRDKIVFGQPGETVRKLG